MKMAQQGINLRTSNDYEGMFKNAFEKDATVPQKILNAGKWTWNNIFQNADKATFGNFMPMIQMDLFKRTEANMLKKGMSEADAQKVAGQAVKNNFGLINEEAKGRSQGTSDTISALFMAPKFREGVINTLSKTIQSIDPRTWKDPAFQGNRRLVVGMVGLYATYNALQKHLTGRFMWENPEGQKFNLMIPDGKGGDTTIPFMPSFTAMPRTAFNMAEQATKANPAGVFKEGMNFCFYSSPARKRTTHQ